MTTKAINADYVLASLLSTSPITPVSGAATAQIVAIGQNVTQWSVSALILFKLINTINYKEASATYIMIPKENILFSYTSPA